MRPQRFDLTGGDVLELTGEAGDPPGVVRRLAPSGLPRWSLDAGDTADVFVDIQLQGEEVSAVTGRGRHYRLGLGDGRIRSVEFVR